MDILVAQKGKWRIYKEETRETKKLEQVWKRKIENV